MPHKDIPLQQVELKAGGDEGIIEGWASVFGGPPDSYGDIIVRGAFADSLKLRVPKFLWQHDMGTPIGKVISLEETDYGLYGRWKLAKTKAAADAYELMKEGLVDGLSIGYLTKDSEVNPDGDRLLKKLNLIEISGVTIPAKDTALITGVKEIPTKQLLERVSEVLREAVREVEARHNRRAAEYRALNDTHIAAFAELVEEAKALAEKLARPVVLPEVEAQAAEMALRLQLARHKLGLRRTA